jgi:cell division protein FtsB
MRLRRRDRWSDDVDEAPAPRRPSKRGRHAEPRARTIARTARRLVGPAILVVITVAVFTLGAFPTKMLLDQRHETAAAEARLAELEAANATAQAEVDALGTDAVIERLAREEYGLARVGQEQYHLIPPAQDPVRVPDAWPFGGLGTTLER